MFLFLPPILLIDATIIGQTIADPLPTETCDDDLPVLLDALAQDDPGEINRLRRILAIENPTCFQQHFGHFARHFLDRLHNTPRQINLHLPKSGGSSLCSVAKEAGKVQGQPSHNNCWEQGHFYPMWCARKFTTRRTWHDCDAMDAELPEFIMNENYLDYPLCTQQRIYSIVIREPVDRAISHEMHLEKFREYYKMTPDTFRKRLSMGRMNYITWALSVDLFDKSGMNKAMIKPGRTIHAEVAMETLSKFDFILEFSRDKACDAASMHFMGFGDLIPGHDSAAVEELKGLHPRKFYEEWNKLDMAVYRYANKLMEVDCEFFARVLNEIGGLTRTTTLLQD